MALEPYYQSEGITLYNGDSREILPQLNAETFDIALTDPPYLVGYTGRWGSDLEPIQGDCDPDWVLPCYSELFRVLRPDSLCLTFYGWPHADIFLSSWRAAGFRPVSICALIKRRIGLGYYTRAQHELAYLLAKGRPRRPQCAPSDVLDWECSGESFHPNQKPVGAMAKLIATYANENTFVIDPFCGSGTTLLAARNCGVSAVGIEIEERFCEVAALRLSQQVLDFDQRAPLLLP